MAEGTIEEQLEAATKKAEEAATRANELESQLTTSEEKLRDVTTESMKRKDTINEMKDVDQQRKQQEQEAQEKAEKKRLEGLPDNERQYAEMNTLVTGLHDVIEKQNAKIDGLVTDVQASSKQSVERQKSAAVDEVLGTINFHNKDDAKRFIDLEEVPTKNGEPDKEWIKEKATAIATEKAYLLKPVETPIPQWGGTSPPSPLPGPKPPEGELTREQKGVKIVERGLTDPAGAVMQALAETPGINTKPALDNALKTPT